MKNTIRQYSLPGYELRDYTTEAIAFLRENEPPEGFFVGFSGGKDSIVSLELCRIAGVKHQAFYSCTRIDPPEVVRFIRMHYPEVTWLYSKMTMWEAIQKKAPPLRMQRWCCDVLKKEPSDNHPLRHRIMGIRAEESMRRWPGIWKVFERTVKTWWMRKKEDGNLRNDNKYKTSSDYWQAYLRGFE